MLELKKRIKELEDWKKKLKINLGIGLANPKLIPTLKFWARYFKVYDVFNLLIPHQELLRKQGIALLFFY